MLAVALAGLALVVVPWLVYPLAVVALARLVGRPPEARALETRTPDDLPAVSYILATRDGADVVQARVADFLAQAYPPDRVEVVVAVDATSPPELRGAIERAATDARVRVVPGDAPGGKCPALNAAVRTARGDLLVFSDARQRFAPDVTRKLAAALAADPRLGITSGRLVLPNDRETALFQLYSRFELALRAAEARLHSAVGVSGSVYAMRRELWAPLPAGLILDDLFVPMRLALGRWRVGFVPDAYAHETRLVKPGQEFRRKVRTLTGNYQLCAWLPAVLVPVRNPLWLQFLCHKLLRLLLPFGVLLFAVGAAGLAWAWAFRAFGPGAWWLVAAAAGGALWLAVGRDALARRLRGLTLQFGTMQAAVVVAAVHGARGRWDVWTR